MKGGERLQPPRRELTTAAARLRSGIPAVGATVDETSDMILDHIGAGIDLVLLDAEWDWPSTPLRRRLALARAEGVALIVRVAQVHDVRRAMMLSPDGIVLTGVPTRARAQAAADIIDRETRHHGPAYGRVPPPYVHGSRGHGDDERPSLFVSVVADVGDDLAWIVDDPAVDGLAVDLGDGSKEAAASLSAAPSGMRAAGKPIIAICRDSTAAQAARSAGHSVVYETHNMVETCVRELAGRIDPGVTPRQPGQPSLVLLPGMLGSHATWEQTAGALAQDVSVDVARIDLDDTVEEMAATVLAMAPPRFALAGHSLGGIVALEIARRRADRVTQLALLNTSARAGSTEQQATWQGLRERVETGAFDDVAEELAVGTLPEDRRADPVLSETVRSMARRVGPAGLLRQLRAQSTRVDRRMELGALEQPTLVISGGDDHVCPVALQEELADGLPRSTHIVLDGVGHMAPLEAPDAIAAHLRRWLDIGF